MKRGLFIAVLVSFFVGGSFISGLVAAEHEAHHPAEAQPAVTAPAPGMAQMPCMAEQAAGSKAQMMGMMGHGMGDMMGTDMSNMMGDGKMGMMGMMEQRMAHMFFLDRSAELGLSAEQVGQLKMLYSDCRKENIRSAAEVKIARLELADLLEGDSWSLQEVEPLVRKLHKLEGDIQVRHLQGLNDARKVLTAEQLKLSAAGGDSGNLENLFQ